MCTPSSLLPSLGAILIASACSVPAYAQFTNFSQSGLALATGSGGTNQQSAPGFSPWNVHMMSNMGPGSWTADAEVVSTWTSSFIEVHSTSAIAPGGPPAISTRAVGQIVLTFDVTAPVLADLEFEVDDFVDPSGVPHDVLMIELRNVTTSAVIHSGAGDLHDVQLTPDTYRLTIYNELGNTPNQLLFASSARLLDIHISVVPAPAGAYALVLAGAMRTRRRRG